MCLEKPPGESEDPPEEIRDRFMPTKTEMPWLGSKQKQFKLN